MKKFLLSLFVFSLFFTGCSELYNNKSNSELQFNISIPKKLYRSSETGNNPIFTLVLSLDFMENTESQQQTFSVTEGQTISTSFTDIKIGSSVKLSAKVIDENNKVLYEGESPYTIIKTGNNKISLTLKYVGQNNDNTGGSGSGNEGTTDPEQPSTPTEPKTANYTVEFYFENVYDDNYTKKDSLTQTKTGNIGEETNYTPSDTQTGFTYHKTENITISKNANNIVKVYYTRNKITLSFKSNGGSTVDDITGKYGATVNLPTAPTKTGYIFEGWYTDENLTNNVEETLELKEDTTLYAKWKPITYTVEFNANGGDGTMNSQTFTYDIKQNLSTNTFTRTNYNFDGWNTAKDGIETPYSDEASVINLTSENYGTVTLYAQWKNQDQVASVTFSVSETAVDHGTKVALTCSESDAEIYYTTGDDDFPTDAWTQYLSPIVITEKTTISAIAKKEGKSDSDITSKTFELKTYTITFNLDGGSFILPTNRDQVTSGATYDLRNLDPKKTGHNFAGWLCNDETVTELTDIKQDYELTAQWEPITWNITYNLDEDTKLEDAPPSHTYGTPTPLPTPTKAGHIFAGWFTDSNFKTQISTIDKTYILDDNTNHINLYAKWISYSVQLPTYKDIEASFSPDEANQLTITVTIPVDCSIVDWYVNGEKQDTNQNTNKNTFTVSTNAFTEGGGIAAIMVLIEDIDGNMYSAEYQITIEK